MSRHGMMFPGAPGWRDWSGRHPVLIFTARVLTREVLIGAVLYACEAAIQGAGGGAGPLGLILGLLWLVVLLWTRRFGLLRPRCWSRAFTEGSLLYVGSVCCTNALLIALNSPLWTIRP